MPTTHPVGQLCRAIWRPAFSALCPCPHPSASGPGASSLSRVGVEVGPLGPLTAGIWLLELILALDLVSRTQTPAGSLLCVHTWPGLGRDDGAQGTVGVSEWKLTAHLPGPTYAGPAAQSLSSGLAGGAGGAGHRHWAQRGPWPVCLQVGGDVWVFRGPCMQRVGGFLEEGPMEPVASRRSWEPWPRFLPP